VLPFENQGDSANAYFADGITDEVPGKLAALNGLQVIASTSSNQYRHTTKPPEQIGRELGVRYLLIGRVRWQKEGAASRVRVEPELLQVTEGHAPTTKWEQPFDAPLTDVFQVQADIAGKVAEQLRVRLGTQDRQALAARPTQNLDAYDAYLRGREIQRGGMAAVVQRRAAAAFRQAVERDSTFALAWAALGVSHAFLYTTGIPTPAEADSALQAAERAVALGPELAATHGALSLYYQLVRFDFARAFAEDSVGLARAPNDAPLLVGAGSLEGGAGRWEAAVGYYERAVRVDPEWAIAADQLAVADLRLRRYAAAQAVADRALALQPENLSFREDRATVSLAQGDLAGARAVLHAAPATVDVGALAAYVAEYNDLGWTLDSGQERALLALGPAAFDNDRANWAIVFTQQYFFRGDAARTRAYADSARAGFEANLKGAPADAQQHVFHALALAYLGRGADAVREGERAAALASIAKNPRLGPYIQHQLVRIYLLTGQRDKALDALEPLLKVPYLLSPGWLKVDPNFAPLRGNPRFERLTAGS
jgi:TolB-like protein/tetratricopeptide (TPR) repeat protein